MNRQATRWTRDEIIEALTIVAKKRHQMSFEEFVRAFKDGQLDPCGDGDMIGLLNLLCADDRVLQPA